MKLTRVTLATASSVLLLAALAACAGDHAATSATEGAPVAGGQQQGGAPAGGGRTPGASGTVAAISGKTIQVQNEQSGQVAVTWTAKTAFTQQVDAALADVKVGACVAVTSDAQSTDGDPVTATSVRITEATDDGCAGGMGGGMGGGPGGGERPRGCAHRPADRPAQRPARTYGWRHLRRGHGGVGGRVHRLVDPPR